MVTHAPGTPIWIDLTVTDLERAKRFYSALFGWEFRDTGADFGHYQIMTKDGLDLGGAMARQPGMDDGTPDAFAVYLATDDAAATADAATSAGGTVVVPVMQIGDQGAMLGVVGPDGAYVGAWQPGARAGIETVPGVGTPNWFELMSTDYDASVSFYGTAFGFTESRMPSEAGMPRYSTHGSSYGVCEAASWVPEGIPSFWRVYFGVPDTDEAVALVQDLGGALLDGPIDSPFGRVATVADDQGVTFQIIEPPAASAAA